MAMTAFVITPGRSKRKPWCSVMGSLMQIDHLVVVNLCSTMPDLMP